MGLPSMEENKRMLEDWSKAVTKNKKRKN